MRLAAAGLAQEGRTFLCRGRCRGGAAEQAREKAARRAALRSPRRQVPAARVLALLDAAEDLTTVGEEDLESRSLVCAEQRS